MEKLKDILKEIGYGEVKVTVDKGKIVALPKQVIQRPKKFGITTQHNIEEVIEVDEN